jgi:hypothetical protein
MSIRFCLRCLGDLLLFKAVLSSDFLRLFFKVLQRTIPFQGSSVHGVPSSLLEALRQTIPFSRSFRRVSSLFEVLRRTIPF